MNNIVRVQTLYEIVLDLQKWGSEGLKEGPKNQILEFCERIKKVADDLAYEE